MSLTMVVAYSILGLGVLFTFILGSEQSQLFSSSDHKNDLNVTMSVSDSNGTQLFANSQNISNGTMDISISDMNGTQLFLFRCPLGGVVFSFDGPRCVQA